MPQSSGTIEIFYSYSHNDEGLRKELEKHLKILEWRGLAAVWHDRQIGAGAEWAKEIDERLESADLILLLISPDFIFSKYCYAIEMVRAMERHDAGEARVIPIFLRDVNWEGAPFSKLQALPTDAQPVASWANQDAAFKIISQGVQKIVEALLDERQRGVTPQGPKPSSARRLYKESLEINKKLRDQSGIAPTLHRLGQIAEAQGNLAEAERFFLESLSIFESLGSPYANSSREALEMIRGKS